MTVTERERLGSRESRRLRKQGLVPGVLYGRSEAIAICLPERELRRALSGAGGLHTILDVVVEGKQAKHASILKDFQRDSIRGTVTHVDLQEVRLDQPIQAAVTVELIGGENAPGVREGGVLSQVSREVNVSALPLEVPEHLDLDVSGMSIGDTLRVADLAVSDGVTFLDDPETVVATVTMPTRAVEEEEAVTDEEAAEGAEAEAGEEAAEAEPDGDAAGDQGTTEG